MSSPCSASSTFNNPGNPTVGFFFEDCNGITVDITRKVNTFVCSTSIDVTDTVTNLGLKYTLQYDGATTPATFKYTNISGQQIIPPLSESSSVLKFSVNQSGVNYILSFDNKDIEKFTCNTAEIPTIVSTTITVSAMRASLLNISNEGCGPILRIISTDTQAAVSVLDKGYSYIVDGLAVKSVKQPNCDDILTEFTTTIPEGLSDQQIINYILSGFVYGYFRVVTDIETFINRLMLTPFRKFVVDVA